MNQWLQVLIVVAALLVSVGLGWLVTVTVLRLAKAPDVSGTHYDADARGRKVPLLEAGERPTFPEPLLRGGTWIGVLERLAATGAIIAGMPTLIAIVVAVKGLGRYPELKENAGASERFIIGTLASLTIAVGLGLLAVWLLDR